MASFGTSNSFTPAPVDNGYTIPVAQKEYTPPSTFNPSQGFNQAFQGAPEWLQNFVQQRSGDGSYFSDTYDRYQPQVNSYAKQYGQSFFDPSFARKGNVDFKQYNPFADQGFSRQVGQFNVNYNPWQGLQGASQGIDYLNHFTTHSKAAKKGAQNGNQGDRNFFSSYGLNSGDDNGNIYESYSNNSMNDALGRARGDLGQLQDLQRQWGY